MSTTLELNPAETIRCAATKMRDEATLSLITPLHNTPTAGYLNPQVGLSVAAWLENQAEQIEYELAKLTDRRQLISLWDAKAAQEHQDALVVATMYLQQQP